MQKRKVLTDKERIEVVRIFKNSKNNSLKFIADKFGVSKGQISGIIDNHYKNLKK